jgi:pimeloyl-ACP methyl ester carboxylesterase
LALPLRRHRSCVSSHREDTPHAARRQRDDAARNEAATLISVDRAAHLGPIEQHERYVAAIRAFADRAAAPDTVAATTAR